MQTFFSQSFLSTARGQEADSILRSCVHCGFCTATCPTYLVLGDELDGPRGRIYEIKLSLEGGAVTRETQMHLDRCLTCLNCETTCPSGVQYHRLLDIGRDYVEQHVRRSIPQQLIRRLLRLSLPFTSRIVLPLKLAQALRGVLPDKLQRKIPPRQQTLDVPHRQHARTMLMLAGCVQPAMTPRTNQATTYVLDKLGINVIEIDKAGCCGALSHHLSATDEAKQFMRKNIDAWWPYIENGVEAIVMTASGCGLIVKEYGYHLKDDAAYAEKAKRVAELTKDISEILAEEDMTDLKPNGPKRIAFHPPCTLQHGQKLDGVVEGVLAAAGFQLTDIQDKHLCCGSAGTYSIIQPALANTLKERKIAALQKNDPELIVTANIGCQLHLQTEARVPVKHWIELFCP